MDFANALTQKMGVKATFRPTKGDGILAALETGRLDVVINQVMISASPCGRPSTGKLP